MLHMKVIVWGSRRISEKHGSITVLVVIISLYPAILWWASPDTWKLKRLVPVSCLSNVGFCPSGLSSIEFPLAGCHLPAPRPGIDLWPTLHHSAHKVFHLLWCVFSNSTKHFSNSLQTSAGYPTIYWIPTLPAGRQKWVAQVKSSAPRQALNANH